jgi:hypothetical protein
MTARWAAALGILSRARPVACAPGSRDCEVGCARGQSPRSVVLGGGERSGPAGGGGQGLWAKSWAGDGEEVLAQCLANVVRQGWMAAKAVAPPGRRTSPRGTADDIPGAAPARPASRPPGPNTKRRCPVSNPGCLAAAPTVIHRSRSGTTSTRCSGPIRTLQAGIDARAPVTQRATMLACGRRSGTRRTRCTRSSRSTGR